MLGKLRTGCIAIAALALLTAPAISRAQNAFDDPGSRAAGGTAGGDLVPVNPKVEGGNVAAGSSSQVVILFRNDDSKPVKTGAINLYPSSNISATVGENQCVGEAVQPGEVCAISIQVKALQAGQYRIEMLMRHDGRAKLLTAAINGTVDSGGDGAVDLISDVEIIPPNIDFGSLTESQAQSKTVILRNKTSKPISIEDMVIEAGPQSGFELSTNCEELQTGSACVATVGWFPQKRGPSSGTLIVKHSGATGVSTAEIAGTYTPEVANPAEAFPQAVPGKGLLISSKEEIDFGTGVAQSSSITVSLVNTGDVPLTISKIFMTNAENGMRAESGGCRSGTSLGPLEACPLTLTWEPVREGNIVDDVQIAHSGARGLLVLPVRGNAARAVNKDRKAITIGGDPGADAIISKIQPLSMNDIVDRETAAAQGAVSKSSGRVAGSKLSTLPPLPDDGEVVMQGGERAVPNKVSRVSSNTLDLDEEQAGVSGTDVRGMLDGYTITSYSEKRAIVTGPGGSRVVFNGERTIIGGILWEITMRPSAVEFKSGKQKVLLLFDKSLSSINLDSGQSNGDAAIQPQGTSAPSQGNTAATPST